jgi:sulfide:quinone oxidoreductase
VIVGGGVVGLEALMALRDLAGNRAELALVAPEPDFLYKPLLVEEPFDLGPAERHELAPLAEELDARSPRRPRTACSRRSTPSSSTMARGSATTS